MAASGGDAKLFARVRRFHISVNVYRTWSHLALSLLGEFCRPQIAFCIFFPSKVACYASKKYIIVIMSVIENLIDAGLLDAADAPSPPDDKIELLLLPYLADKHAPKGKVAELRLELNSGGKKDKNHSAKKIALKKIVANMTMSNNDMVALFPDVVGCMQIPSLEIKKM